MSYLEGLSDARTKLEGCFQQPLVGFWFSAAVLVRNSIFIEQCGHFLGDHVTVVLNGDEWDFFSHLGHGLWRGSLGGLGGGSFWGLTHAGIIHHAGDEKGSYSNASKEDCSGYVFWHEVQVRK